MSLPNFIIIGTQKAGTTALAHYLKQHPKIYISPAKEPGFFDFEGKKPNFCGPGDQPLYAHVPTDIETYSELFNGVKDEIAVGEATTWYLYSPRAAERIHNYIPDAKMIVILRNPVDRAYSGFMHAIRDEREKITDFSQALQEEEKRIANNWEYLWRYKDMGFYSVQLKRYFDKFERSQIKVYLYEEFDSNPLEVLKDILKFLNVDDELIPEVFTRLNISGVRKSKALEEIFLSDRSSIKKFLKPLMPIVLRKKIANFIRTNNYVKQDCSLEVRQELVEIFKQDIYELQNLLNRDLSSWLII
jgi:Sulfotransferase family